MLGHNNELTKPLKPYRLADILRGAHSLAIVVAEEERPQEAVQSTIAHLLREWGARVWTLPEVLLSPCENIRVYTKGGGPASMKMVRRNEIPREAWGANRQNTAAPSRMDIKQLLDHYLGSLSLSRLELATIALQCLYRLDTGKHLKGQRIYALMGLLRHRPPIVKDDGDFEAFAR